MDGPRMLLVATLEPQRVRPPYPWLSMIPLTAGFFSCRRLLRLATSCRPIRRRRRLWSFTSCEPSRWRRWGAAPRISRSFPHFTFDLPTQANMHENVGLLSLSASPASMLYHTVRSVYAPLLLRCERLMSSSSLCHPIFLFMQHFAQHAKQYLGPASARPPERAAGHAGHIAAAGPWLVKEND